MKSNPNYTIKDIAQMAGVSRGTVDRVIHGRGIVSKDTYNKIKLILDRIDYQPNLAAQSLRKGALFKIAVLVPDGDLDSYWKRAMTGIEKAIKELSFVGVNVSMHLFNSLKEVSFTYNANQVLKEGCDGVLVAPIFYNEAIEFFKKCEERGISYATFNTDIKEINALCHVGQDLVKSGETAASLLKKVVGKADEYLIVHIDVDISNARHIQEKENGFVNFMAQNNIGADKIKKLTINNPKVMEKELMALLDKFPKIKGVYVTTSKVYYIADIIEAYSLDLKLIGYDLIDENRSHLKKGNIEFLIYQNPGLQASSALSLLVDYLAFKKDVPKQKLLPIEIVIKENYKDYTAWV
ncbi:MULTISPECIES: LacI family DNA-binding transcriptional regulator [unclassified Saccharicrinis]|uniref:LacI family DNA-binding transcriptional regulator n=1 Tax=unclassified Saccharicrinis TaxID=2646859 RepID=UPI003D32D520